MKCYNNHFNMFVTNNTDIYTVFMVLAYRGIFSQNLRHKNKKMS